jgi:hypothetical protein
MSPEMASTDWQPSAVISWTCSHKKGSGCPFVTDPPQLDSPAYSAVLLPQSFSPSASGALTVSLASWCSSCAHGQEVQEEGVGPRKYIAG